MKFLFEKGDIKTFEIEVTDENIASFDSGNVHKVLSTFSVGKYAEWVCRLFAIDMKNEDEEGIGTFLEVKHQSAALIGEKVLFTGVFDRIDGNEIICNFTAVAGKRLVASGKTGQKILKKDKIESIFNKLKSDG